MTDTQPIKFVPPLKPKYSIAEAMTRLEENNISKVFAVLGLRGFFADADSDVKNRIGVYDDAIFLVTPTLYLGFNANTDPSKERPGMATLNVGTWAYRLGIHGLSKPVEKQYEALVQAKPVTVTRWPEKPGDAPKQDTGLFGINIHRGGYTTTGSEGCQTIHPDQWTLFIKSVKDEMMKHQRTVIPYVLLDARV